MKPTEIKQKSLAEINKAIVILQCKKEKVTNKRISEVSGLSLRTVATYRKKEKVQPISQKVQAESEKMQAEKQKVQPSKDSSDAFKQFLRRKVY